MNKFTIDLWMFRLVFIAFGCFVYGAVNHNDIIFIGGLVAEFMFIGYIFYAQVFQGRQLNDFTWKQFFGR